MRLIVPLMLFLVNISVFGGGGASRVITGVGLGIVTGGAGFALGAPLVTATTAGVVTAVGVGTGIDTHTGVEIGPNGTNVVAGVGDGRGGNWEVHAGPERPDLTPVTDPFRVQREREERMRREEESRRAQNSFSNWSSNTTYGVKMVNGLEYHMAHNTIETFLTLGVGCGWSKTSRAFIGYSTFTNQPGNLVFEKTPLLWHFGIEVIDGRRYNHAWSDTLLDFLVPEGERHQICAPDWYVKQCQLEMQPPRTERSFDELMAEARRASARGYIEETIYGSLNYARAMNLHDESSARGFANQALEYYGKAIDVLRPIGYFLDDVVEELATPGGIENLRKYRDGEISSWEYDLIVNGDIATDSAASSVGAIIGGSAGGAAGAVAGGPALAVAGTNLGAAKGAVAGYVASRAARAVARTAVSWFKGTSGASRERTQAVKQDADNYINGLNDKGVLSRKGRTTDGHDYFKVERKCEYMGIKFKKGDYLSRDTLHHEWELFSNPREHRGAIDPLTGKLNTLKARPNRTLKVQ